MKLVCRFNLIEGELLSDSTDKTIVFIRYSLGEEELYRTWNYKDIREIQVQRALLTTDLIFELQSNETLRFSTSMDVAFIEYWIENFYREKQNTQKQNHLEQSKTSVPNKKRSKKSKNNKPVQKSKIDESDNSDTNNPNNEELSLSETTNQETDLDNQKKDQRVFTESQHDPQDVFAIEDIFRDRPQTDVTYSDTSSPKTTQTTNIEPTTNSEEPKENKNCCGCIFWIVLIFIVLGSLT